MDKQSLSTETKKDTAITSKRQITRGAISKAVYMITDLFEVDEPLKDALRTAAVDTLRYTDVMHVAKLRDLLVLSGEVGLVSTTNTEILVQAVSSLQDAVTPSQKEVDIHPVLNTIREDGPIERYEQDEGLVAEKEVTMQQPILQKEAKVAQKVVERPLVQQSAVTLDIGARRKKILEVVRSKGQATIHEFIESIQGCSSKTIQRELTSLVLSGTLKKTGERRWSKYSLR